MAKTATIVKSAFFTVIVPGAVAGVVPFLLARNDLVVWSPHLSSSVLAGGFLMACGAGLSLWSVGLFTFVGQGTPAPIDPPRHLVIKGAYRYTRNPMYLGVAAILFGEALCVWSLTLFVYAACVSAGFHAFAVFYEEPALRRQFGDAYIAYCRTTPRWLPRRPT